MKTSLQKVWAKVDKTETCWLWTGAKSRSGYGHVVYAAKHWPAHRLIYELEVGPIPEGLQLDHLCRERRCVRPDHLEPVTAAENTRRAVAFRTPPPPKSHCPHGHAYTDENLIADPRGRRLCRACKSRRSVAHNRKNPDAHVAHVVASQQRAIDEGRCPKCGDKNDRDGYLCTVCLGKYNVRKAARRAMVATPW